MDAFEADVRRRIAGAPPGRERGEAALAALRSTFPFLLTIMPLAAAGVASTRILPRLARRWLDEAEIESLTLGIPGNVVNAMNLAIDDLAAMARRSPALADKVRALAADTVSGTDGRGWLATLADGEGGEAFLAALDAFLDRYGARAPAEIDVSMPRWREDPRPVLAVVAASLERNGPTYRERIARFEADREEAFARLLERAGRGPLGALRRRVFRRLYRVMVEVGGMREHHKFVAVRTFAAVKEVVTKAAKELHARNVVDRPGDVWYVPWPRLLEAMDGAVADLRSEVWTAREAHERNQRLTPPMVVTSDGEIPRVERSALDAPPGVLLGQSVSVGVVEGPVHVVRDPSRDELEPGEILVAEFTDPGWTPLFMNAAGLVSEVGGVLTHGAVVAREYGIPAVVGVRGATTVLRTGQRVRVDGVRGFVEVLDDDGSPDSAHGTAVPTDRPAR